MIMYELLYSPKSGSFHVSKCRFWSHRHLNKHVLPMEVVICDMGKSSQYVHSKLILDETDVSICRSRFYGWYHGPNLITNNDFR